MQDYPSASVQRADANSGVYGPSNLARPALSALGASEPKTRVKRPRPRQERRRDPIGNVHMPVHVAEYGTRPRNPVAFHSLLLPKTCVRVPRWPRTPAPRTQPRPRCIGLRSILGRIQIQGCMHAPWHVAAPPPSRRCTPCRIMSLRLPRIWYYLLVPREIFPGGGRGGLSGYLAPGSR